MDRDNLDDLEALSRRTEGKAQVMLFGEFAAAGGKAGDAAEEIDDPYYGGDEGFKVAYEQCRRFSGNFLKALEGVEG
jgi:low molecular weight phosphotyrosine protein phosphatase